MRNNRIIFLLMILPLVLSIQSCRKSKGQNQFGGAVPVVDYTVQPRKISVYDSYPGTVVALNEVDLRSQVTGYLTGIFFREGSQVAKGERLYEIDRRKYQAGYEQAVANADIAGANLEKAQRDVRRYTILNEQNAIARQTFDDATTNLRNSKMQLASAKAALLNAETDYNYSLITAPFTGTIGLSLVKPGTLVNAGQTLLNTISSDDPMGVDFIINEKSLPGFLELRNLTETSSDSTFKILLPDNSVYPLNGKLGVIDRAVNPQTGTIRIRLVFPNPQRILRAGMNCRVKVLSRGSGDRIIVPNKAVIEQMGEYFVYVIDSMKAKQTRIEPGNNLGEYLVINRGVNPGDKIVLEGLQKIRNGSMVQTGSPSGKRNLVMR